jgi:hypothetical protein
VAGDPQDEGLRELADGAVLKPDRLTGLVLEIGKDVVPRPGSDGQ